MSTDATKRPLKIPVNYQNYAEEQGVFDLVSQMMESLLISKPADPLNFLIDFLHKDDHRVVKVAIIGPPGSGKSTIADSLAAATNSLVKNDLEEFCTESVDSKEGWVLDGFPRNRKEVLKLQEKGHLIDYVIVLYASEDALRQRMIDGDDSFTENFKEYTKNKEMVIKDHSKVVHRINCDQPIDTVNENILRIVSQKTESAARLIVKAVFLGPTGSGKRTVAVKMARNWNVVPIDVNELIKREILNKTRIGMELERDTQNVSARTLGKLLKGRLELEDCVKRGYMLYSFPDLNLSNSIEALLHEGFTPNRVVVFQISKDSALERLSNRLVDPKDGKQYHLLYDPPTADAVRNRLVKRSDDEPEAINYRFDNYEVELSRVLDLLSETQPLIVNADQDQEIVYQLVESKLSKPVPTKSFSMY